MGRGTLVASSRPLDTYELGQVVTADIARLGCQGETGAEVFFEEDTPCSIEGIYVFADSGGYHYVLSERGSKSIHKVTDDLFEIRFWVVGPLAFEMAVQFERKNRVSGLDERELVHYKYLELLDNVGANFKRRGEIVVSEALKLRPYRGQGHAGAS